MRSEMRSALKRQRLQAQEAEKRLAEQKRQGRLLMLYRSLQAWSFLSLLAALGWNCVVIGRIVNEGMERTREDFSSAGLSMYRWWEWDRFPNSPLTFAELGMAVTRGYMVLFCVLLMLIEGNVTVAQYNFRLLTRPLFRILMYLFIGVDSASDRLSLADLTVANLCCYMLVSTALVHLVVDLCLSHLKQEALHTAKVRGMTEEQRKSRRRAARRKRWRKEEQERQQQQQLLQQLSNGLGDNVTPVARVGGAPGMMTTGGGGRQRPRGREGGGGGLFGLLGGNLPFGSPQGAGLSEENTDTVSDAGSTTTTSSFEHAGFSGASVFVDGRAALQALDEGAYGSVLASQEQQQQQQQRSGMSWLVHDPESTLDLEDGGSGSSSSSSSAGAYGLGGSGRSENDSLLDHQHHREVVHSGSQRQPAMQSGENYQENKSGEMDDADLDGALGEVGPPPLTESPPNARTPKNDNPYE